MSVDLEIFAIFQHKVETYAPYVYWEMVAYQNVAPEYTNEPESLPNLNV